jgi:hypothetical protein
MQVVNVMTLIHHPFEEPSFIYNKDMLKIYGQNIGNFLNLLNENSLYDKRPLLGLPPFTKIV